MGINFLDYRQELQRIVIQKLVVKAIAIIFLTSFVILSYWGYQQIKIKFSEIELEKLETRVKSLSTAAAEVQGMKLNIKRAAESIKEISRVRNSQLQVLQILESLTLSIPNGIWLTKIEQLSFDKISSVKGISAFLGKPKIEEKGKRKILKVQGNMLKSATDNPLTTYIKALRKINYFKKVHLQKINLKSNMNLAALNFTLYIQLS
jgi:Tfp pilus assembly protein PilN